MTMSKPYIVHISQAEYERMAYGPFPTLDKAVAFAQQQAETIFESYDGEQYLLESDVENLIWTVVFSRDDYERKEATITVAELEKPIE
jgi:hypothetical protein